MNELLQDKKLLIFDCDGVIFNSHKANTEYFFTCLRQAGIHAIPDEFLGKIRYLSLRQLIHEIFGDSPEGERVYSISLTIDYEPFLEMITPLFNLNEVLGQLKSRFYTAVASNRGRSLEQVLRYFCLDEFFHFTISSVDARPKPDPDMLFKCVDFFNVSREETLFFGDSISDYTAAVHAGIPFIWVGDNKVPGIPSVSDLVAVDT